MYIDEWVKSVLFLRAIDDQSDEIIRLTKTHILYVAIIVKLFHFFFSASKLNSSLFVKHSVTFEKKKTITWRIDNDVQGKEHENRLCSNVFIVYEQIVQI